LNELAAQAGFETGNGCVRGHGRSLLWLRGPFPGKQ
jgi:hypothetical protein